MRRVTTAYLRNPQNVMAMPTEDAHGWVSRGLQLLGVLVLVAALVLAAAGGIVRQVDAAGESGGGLRTVWPQVATPLADGTPVPCVGGENLLPNAGFEAGMEGWYVDDSVEPVTTESHEGTMAVRLGARDDDAYMDHGVSPVALGATYTLSGWGKLSSGGETGEIGVQFYDGDGERLTSEEPAPLTFTSTDFAEQRRTFSLPEQVAQITVYLSKVAGAADFSADSLSLTSCGREAPAEVPAGATPVATPSPEMQATPTEAPVVATPTEEPIVATPVASLAAEVTATAPEPAADRSGCDPAYPEERTCIPPGPPFAQGCAITRERNFVVLPPDPQGLDRDQDGIGCEPIRQ